MKKILSILIGLSLAVSAFGEGLSQVTMTISTEGPDAYADGTPVLVGETYLLVYVKSGEFEGVRSDGTLVNPAKDLKVTTSLAVEGSKCGFKAIQYPETLYPAGGTWVIVLLDTRDANGNLGGLVTGHSDAVPAAKSVAQGSMSPGGMRVLADAGGSGSGLTVGSLARAPSTTPNPVIAAVEPNGTAVGLKIKNFTDTANYEVQTRTSLASGNWEPAVGGVKLQARTLGVVPGPAAEMPATLTVPADDTVRFFRVIVPGGK